MLTPIHVYCIHIKKTLPIKVNMTHLTIICCTCDLIWQALICSSKYFKVVRRCDESISPINNYFAVRSKVYIYRYSNFWYRAETAAINYLAYVFSTFTAIYIQFIYCIYILIVLWMPTGCWEVFYTFTSLVLSLVLRVLLCTVSDNLRTCHFGLDICFDSWTVEQFRIFPAWYILSDLNIFTFWMCPGSFYELFYVPDFTKTYRIEKLSNRSYDCFWVTEPCSLRNTY